MATCDDIEATGLHFALVFGLDRVRALGQSQQENRSLGREIEHRTAAAVDNAQVHVGNEFVLSPVVLRERHPHRKLRTHVTHEIGLLHADSTVQVPDLALPWKRGWSGRLRRCAAGDRGCQQERESNAYACMLAGHVSASIAVPNGNHVAWNPAAASAIVVIDCRRVTYRVG